MSFDPQCILEGTNLPTTATLLVTGAAGSKTTLTKFTVVNYSASSATFSFWIVAAGEGSPSDAARMSINKAIPAGQTVAVTEMQGQTLNAGDSIWGAASNATTLAARISANVVT